MVDTNVVIYAYDTTETVRREQATQLLQQLLRERRLVLSTQTLNEFYAVATRPNRPGVLSHDRALQILRNLVAGCETLPLTPAITFRALDAVPRHGLSFWDALIWAAARENDVGVIYSEDFQDGREIEGVRFVNPFVDRA